LAKHVRGPETQNYKMRLHLCNMLSKLPYSYTNAAGLGPPAPPAVAVRGGWGGAARLRAKRVARALV
jgi:hypothetical protein